MEGDELVAQRKRCGVFSLKMARFSVPARKKIIKKHSPLMATGQRMVLPAHVVHPGAVDGTE